MIVTDKDEEESANAELEWQDLIHSPGRQNNPEWLKYRFAMTACAVDEVNANPNIRKDFRALVYEADWYHHSSREIYQDIMLQILHYLQRAEVIVRNNPDIKSFVGTRDIPNPFKPKTRPRQGQRNVRKRWKRRPEHALQTKTQVRRIQDP